MKISVIIPFRKKLNITEECIDSVLKQNYKNIEIITVSNINKIEMKGVKSVLNTNCKGVGDKRNLGAKKSKGEVLFFLDSDCIVKKDTFTNLIKIFKETKANAISGKPLAPRKSNLLGYVTGMEYEDRFDQMGENFVNIAATTCLAVRGGVFKKIGGFRDYTTGEATGEDWDFSSRLVKAGLKIFHTNKVEVYHEHGSDTLWKYLKRQYMHAKYRPTHTKKYGKTTDDYLDWKGILSSSLLLGIPSTIRILKKTRDKKILILPFVVLLRNFAWFFGGISGFFNS